MRVIRELAAATTGLAVALALVLMGAPSATAGGGTSVLVVSPTSWQSTALYHDDAAYPRLQALLAHAGGDLDGAAEQPPTLDETTGHHVTVTWMAHDVTPWRVDHVYPTVPETRAVWIHTKLNPQKPGNGVWHKAERPEELRALLKKLGVMDKTSVASASPSETAPSGSVTDESSPTTAPAAASPPRPGDDTGWWWALPGAAAGAVLALVLRPLALRLPQAAPLARLRRQPGPRQELKGV
ncbi:hypothetical protein PV963_28510 [Streptomyces coeruleorubidus]|uniref:hypothetical protein n=1 Tax=Streptomyces coeruleorubidus TaxID=116188 RepID=UPI00237F4E2A|nr:hypothetical protein [Streptomyces coeruleorubidus]WDV54021.1 hypothetical protein PV963_28510 [Streptomyces coeruleorubidus]